MRTRDATRLIAAGAALGVACLAAAWLTSDRWLPWTSRVEAAKSPPASAPAPAAHDAAAGVPASEPDARRTSPVPIHASLLQGSTTTNQVPQAKRGARESATALAKRGWELMETGDYRGAAETFSEAVRLAPNEPSFLVGLGFSRHRLDQYDLAVSALRRAIQLDPNAHQAHQVLGEIYAQRRELETAIHHYEVAGRLDPNDVTIQTSLRTLRQEWEEEAGFDRLFTPHFLLKFRGLPGRQAANLVAEPLEAVYRSVGLVFSYLPSEPLTVILYPDRQFREVTLSPDWAGGFFDGRILLSLERLPRKRASLDAVLRHEYVHAVVYRLSGGQAPTWLDEGLALYLTGGNRSRDLGLLARHREQVASLQALHGSFLDLPPRMAEMAYAESYGATRLLVQRYGLRRVRQLLEALSVEPDFSASFASVLGDRYRDFDAAWMAQQTGARS